VVVSLSVSERVKERGVCAIRRAGGGGGAENSFEPPVTYTATMNGLLLMKRRGEEVKVEVEVCQWRDG